MCNAGRIHTHAPASGSPAALQRFHLLAQKEDWAGMVQMADQVRAVLKGKNEVTTMTLQNLALAYWRVPATQGRDLVKSAELLEEVEGMFEVLGQVQGQLSCWNSLISLLVKAGRPSEAAKWTEKLMDYATISEDHDLIGMHGVFLGEALVSAQSTDNAQLAIPFLERALAASTKCEGPQADNDLRMKALAALGCAYMDLEQFDKALETTTLSVSTHCSLLSLACSFQTSPQH